MTRPRVVTVSCWLWWVAAGLSALTVLLTLVRMDAVRAVLDRAVRDSDPEATRDMIDQVVDASVSVIVAGGLLVGVLGGLLALRLRTGRGWVRVALTVVAVLAVAYGVLVVSATGWVVLCYSGVAAAAATCMYLPGGARWFT